MFFRTSRRACIPEAYAAQPANTVLFWTHEARCGHQDLHIRALQMAGLATDVKRVRVDEAMEEAA